MRKRILRLLGRAVAALTLVACAAVWAGPSAAGAAPQAWGTTTHIVKPGETLYGIAAMYGVGAAAIASANGIFNPNFIYAGQALTIPGAAMPGPGPGPGWGGPPPAGNAYHTVRLGDTLYGIAWQYGTSVSAILAANHIGNPDYIYAGQQLVIPGRPQAPDHGPTGRPWPQPTDKCGAYVVRPGDSLSGIAARHGTTVHALATANGLRYPNLIYPGQSIRIPCGHTPPKTDRPGHPKPKPTARPDLRPAACAREVQIVSPREGEHVSGTLQVVGTAQIPNFQFYKVEYAMGHTPLDGNFASINHTYSTAVRDGVLTTWYTGNMPAGAYTLRLTVVDHTGNFPRPCDVHMFIDR